MPSTPSWSTPSVFKVEEFLADQEGLTGRARHQFLQVLENYGGFHRPTRTRDWRFLLLVTLTIAAADYILNDAARSRLDFCLWSGSLLLAAWPIWRVRALERNADGLNRRTEWRAYCLFLRPIILSAHPGLLDRNRVPASENHEAIESRPLPLLKDLFKVRGPDLWWSCLLGLWVGMLGLFLLRVSLPDNEGIWLGLFPIGGLLIGPFAWSLWQALIYRLGRP